MQNVVFRSIDTLQSVINDDTKTRTMLTAFFEVNQVDEFARGLLYQDFPRQYTWHPKKNEKFWRRRKLGGAISRVVYANPSEGDRYYLWLLLTNVRGLKSFDDLLTVNHIKYMTFREATFHRGLLEADDSIEKCLKEAIQVQIPFVLRRLFATLLVYCNPEDPSSLYDKYYPYLSEDFKHTFPSNVQKVRKLTIKSICYLVEAMGESFSTYNFGTSDLIEDTDERRMKEIEEELHIPISPQEISTVDLLNNELKNAYDIIYNKVLHNQPVIYFVDGPGGTCKTFIYCALLANLRAKGMIALAVATSGIAASSLSGGRTANSRFKIPLDIEENESPNISKHSALAELIRTSKLIISDEAPIAKRQTIEYFDRLLQDLCSNEQLFWGNIVVIGGDFRQVLPVIPKGSLREVINTSFVMSPLWSKLHKLHLTQNMRAIHDPSFCNFVLQIGNGIPHEYGRNVKLPSSFVVPHTNYNLSIQHLIESDYPDICHSTTEPMLMSRRAILTAKNEDAEEINSILVAKHPGESHEYKSFDTGIDDSAEQYPIEFLNTLSPTGLPPHKLLLKKIALSYYFATWILL